MGKNELRWNLEACINNRFDGAITLSFENVRKNKVLLFEGRNWENKLVQAGWVEQKFPIEIYLSES